MSTIPLNIEQFSSKITDFYRVYNTTLSNKQKTLDKSRKNPLASHSRKSSGEKIKIITAEPGKEHTLTGVIEFFQDNDQKSLGFFLTTDKRIYKEEIFLPISISLHQTINKIKNQIENINKEILDYLEYGDSETTSIDIEYFRKLKHLLDFIIHIKGEHIKTIVLEKNHLLQLENELVKRDKELFKKTITAIESADEDFSSAANEYFVNHFKLDQPNIDENQPILVGTTIIINSSEGDETTGIVETIDKARKEYKLTDGKTVKFNKATTKPGVRYLLHELKQEEDMIHIDPIIAQLTSRWPELIPILLDITNILPQNIVISRPYLSYSYLDKGQPPSTNPSKLQFVDDKQFIGIVDVLYNTQNIILIGTSNFNRIELINIGDCRKKLSLKHLEPFIVDGFTFLSPLHYQTAAQFYNRLDLDDSLRVEYNHFFLQFTQEYVGPDKLYDIPIKQLTDLSLYTSFRKYHLWDKNIDKNPSLSSLYLRKAMYQKIIQNEELKQCLLLTGDCILYKKIKKNMFITFDELMEVRQFIQNEQVPDYAFFNYDPNIKLAFEYKIEVKKGVSNKHLMEVMIRMNAYEERYNLLDLENPTSPILEAFIAAYPSETPDVDAIQNVLFSYKGDYYFNLVEQNRGISLERLLKTNPELNDDIQLFSFIYVLSNYLQTVNEEKMLQQVVQQETTIKDLETSLKQKEKEIIEGFKLRIYSAKYNSDDITLGLENSLYQAVIKNMISQVKYPFNFLNPDNRPALFWGTKDFKLINGVNTLIYSVDQTELANALSILLQENRPDDVDNIETLQNETNTNYKLQLELLSSYLGADITVIGQQKMEIKYQNTTRLFPNLTEDMVDFGKKRVHIVIGRLDGLGEPLFVNLIPDFSQRDNCFEYLLDANKNIFRELEDETPYIGVWDPKELTIDYQQPMPEINEDEELEFKIMRFCEIDGRLYYNFTQIV
jgi:hypothetical protein